MPDTAGELVAVADRLRAAVSRLAFADPVAYVYNPLAYAWAPHRAYLERFGARSARVLLLGMNPGPFGMAQTGVPFGDVGIVTEWLQLDGAVGRPENEHPRRPVLGFDCRRGEVSGRRLWGWARDTYARPERFFDDFFVWNYCPLAFMEASGRNRTPDKLPSEERMRLYAPCDAALRAVIEAKRLSRRCAVRSRCRRRRGASSESGEPGGESRLDAAIGEGAARGRHRRRPLAWAVVAGDRGGGPIFVRPTNIIRIERIAPQNWFDFCR